ncbi:Techylectin-5B-like protein [Leptotrombidium deliense]|uniref:Techylectin-5B-like protein n=1 Tax=Leptotrombidium deliense TaxID=299467 RepID=A0A443S7F2_9ACAR|nr:Techylectin-5B-like protein [Leptotrombidium deliense]
MTDVGGGWIVIMRRGKFGNSRVTQFNKTWNEYKIGFGQLDDEFWLGNELIHLLTTMNANELQIDLEAENGDFISLRYDHFEISDESDGYRLKIGKPKSVIPNVEKIASSFRNHNHAAFSTYDRDNSGGWANCALKYGGGWWFDSIKCHYVFLNAMHSNYVERRRSAPEGIIWQSWKNETLKAVQMKIRTKH